MHVRLIHAYYFRRIISPGARVGTFTVASCAEGAGGEEAGVQRGVNAPHQHSGGPAHLITPPRCASLTAKWAVVLETSFHIFLLNGFHREAI